MKFYHGTTEKNWLLIQEEGILFGGGVYHKTNGKEGYRFTYLAPEKHYAMGYGKGEVLLEVEYEPKGVGVKDNDGKAYDNYGFDPPEGMICWQFSVFKAIPINKVKRILK